MKRTKLLVLLFAAALLAGCKNSQDANPHSQGTTNQLSTSDAMPLPTHAQPKLPTIKLYVGAEILDTEQALTPREQQTGMMFRTNVTDQSAMLFVLPGPLLPPEGFWMTNCPVSLSAAYIAPDGIIEEIHHLEKNDCVPVVATNNNIVFVLETSDGWFQRHHVTVGMVIRTEKGSLQQTYFPNEQ